MPEFHEPHGGESKPISSWDEEALLAYAAGILDGEGAITIHQMPSKGFHLYVQVALSQKGWGVIDFLANHLGGQSKNKPYQQSKQRGWKRTTNWSGRNAYLFLKKVRPYLLLKDLQADLAFQFQETMDFLLPCGRKRMDSKRRWSDESIQIGERFAVRMKELNRKGPLLPQHSMCVQARIDLDMVG